MRENKFRKWIRTEIETEAEALEKKAEENTELSSLHMPEDSFADLMSRIEAEKKNAAENSSAIRPFHIRRRTLVAVALAAVLLAALGLGASGERLFAPTVESEITDGEYNVTIISGDEEIYMDVTEEEAYDEIEDRLGILALRLGYKPKGMELTKVTIGEDMGEAQMEFTYGDFVLRIYENKQSKNACDRSDRKVRPRLRHQLCGREPRGPQHQEPRNLRREQCAGHGQPAAVLQGCLV